MSEGRRQGRRPRLDAHTAVIRNEVRRLLDEPLPGSSDAEPARLPDATASGTWVIAVSGGADSMALAAACAHLQTVTAHRFTAVTVDHGLQPGSGDIAQATVRSLQTLGLEARVETVTVDSSAGGTEAAARAARYGALRQVMESVKAAAILTGHTLDDQAETVLLGLLRGSGARSLAGMRRRADGVCRPLLSVTREATRASALAQGLPIWDDPMNEDTAYARVRVRREILPVLEERLGGGIRANLARTAGLLAADSDELDAQAQASAERFVSGAVLSRSVAQLPAALMRRIVRDWLQGLCPPGELTAGHIGRVCELATGAASGAVSVPHAAEVRLSDPSTLRFQSLRSLNDRTRDERVS